MPNNINLESEWSDPETIKVSWTEKISPKTIDHHPRHYRRFKASMTVIGSCVVAFLFAVFFNLELIGILSFLGAISGFGIIVHTMTRNVTSSVKIGKKTTSHEGFDFPTAEISRVEYGLESSLMAGSTIGKGQQDAHIVRLWLKDETPIVLSENNWDAPANHKIRVALVQAIDTVRDLDRQQAHAEEFGSVGDDGMPDY